VCVDLVPGLSAVPHARPGELVEVGALAVHAGGCVANTGGDLAALGLPVQVAAEAGDDELGATLHRLLTARGVGTAQLRLRPGRSTSYSLVLEPPGVDRSFWHHVGANAEYDGTGIDLSGIDLLHVGYPSLLPAMAADGGEPLAALFARARAAGVTTSLDLAVLDPASPAARYDWAGFLTRVLPLVDVFSPSVDDVRTALHLDLDRDPAGLRRVADRFLDMGAAVVMLTAGTAGMQLSTADGARHFLVPPRVPVRTTVGAGDAATAGLLYGLLANLDPRACLECAARTAAARVSGTPARPP
jgi:sugar/nucleoside kinase (ribokinase family)